MLKPLVLWQPELCQKPSGSHRTFFIIYGVRFISIGQRDVVVSVFFLSRLVPCDLFGRKVWELIIFPDVREGLLITPSDRNY